MAPRTFVFALGLPWLLCGLATVAGAADNYQQITDLSSATSLTIPDSDFHPFSGCVIHAEGGNIRWRNDGTSPTSTVGNLIYDTGSMVVGERLAEVQLIEVTANTKANVYYFINPLPAIGSINPSGEKWLAGILVRGVVRSVRKASI